MTGRTATRRVLVVGGGIGGLTAGAAFAQRGIDVDIVEIKPEMSVYGVGIIQPGNALRALDAIGVLGACLDAGFAYERWDWFDGDGQHLLELPVGLGGDGVPPMNGITRQQLHEILTDAAISSGAQLHMGVTVDELDDRPDTIHTRLTDGTTGDYDLVVGFDGIRSPLRHRLFGEVGRPEYTGLAVWRFTTERDDEVVSGHMYMGTDAKAGLVPMSDELMYLLLVTEEEAGVLQPADKHHDSLRQRLTSFGGRIAEIRERITDPASVVYSPLEEVHLPPPWSKGRVVVCGDAAHASMPHLAQGAAMAVEDAVVLAEMCTETNDIPSTLQAFTDRRFERCAFVQRTSRAIADMERGASAPVEALPYDQQAGFAAAIDAELNKPT